ncbi:sulfite exporter TauE/SafE family protein [Candidatus Magnetomonas plexicatena]|nr:sulfite exporter TauE/SafE family protein [Nitrospirales bacterium LBB_01]
MVFPISGVRTSVLVPPLFAFVLSFFTSMGGVSGAVLIMPFQVSILGYTLPSVNSTNLLYNIIGIPGGVYKYIRDKKMVWPLTWVIIVGTIPGVFIGYYLRVKFMPDARTFKLFIGIVLAYVGMRLLTGALAKKNVSASKSGSFIVTNARFTLKRVEYEFMGEKVSFSTAGMFALAFIVGIIGGAYGIGGGAIIAPFCVTMFNLPVYTVSGPALMGTFITSVFGIIFYSLIPVSGVTSGPDWLLGFLFGIGGFAGMYLGAKTQKHMPEKWIKLILSVIFMFIAIQYIYKFF